MLGRVMREQEKPGITLQGHYKLKRQLYYQAAGSEDASEVADLEEAAFINCKKAEQENREQEALVNDFIGLQDKAEEKEEFTVEEGIRKPLTEQDFNTLWPV